MIEPANSRLLLELPVKHLYAENSSSVHMVLVDKTSPTGASTPFSRAPKGHSAKDQSVLPAEHEIQSYEICNRSHLPPVTLL